MKKRKMSKKGVLDSRTAVVEALSTSAFALGSILDVKPFCWLSSLEKKRKKRTMLK
jgi:hypothetical protein